MIEGVKLLRPSFKELRYDCWRWAKGWGHFFETNTIEECYLCGIKQTYPINTVKFFTRCLPSDLCPGKSSFRECCYNHKDVMSDDIIDCLTGEKIVLPNVDRLYKVKYNIKKFVVDLYCIYRFCFLLIKHLGAWYIVAPIKYRKVAK